MTETLRFVNLTPHSLTVFNGDATAFTIPASGQVARVSEEARTAGTILAEREDAPPVEIPLSTLCQGIHVHGLPEPEAGCGYIVSRLAAQAAADRSDLYCPGPEVRDETGRIIGCTGLYHLEG